MTTPRSIISESHSCTDAKLIHFTPLWTITHFSHYLGKEGTLQSSRFVSPSNDALRFYLALYVKDNHDPNDQDDIGLYLYLESAGTQKELTVNYKISIVNANGLYNIGGFSFV